jgi:hypothetical protein
MIEDCIGTMVEAAHIDIKGFVVGAQPWASEIVGQGVERALRGG